MIIEDARKMVDEAYEAQQRLQTEYFSQSRNMLDRTFNSRTEMLMTMELHAKVFQATKAAHEYVIAMQELHRFAREEKEKRS